MSSSLAASPDTLVALGMDARVELVDGQIRIHRSGAMGVLMSVLGHGDGLGEKTIPVRMLSSIEIVRTFILGAFCFEYMRFSYAGSPERGGSAWRDAMLENIVVMGMFDNRDFYALKDAVEREMVAIRVGASMAPPPDSAPDSPSSPPPAPRGSWPARAAGWARTVAERAAERAGEGSPPLGWKGAAAAVAVAGLVLAWSVLELRAPPRDGSAPEARLVDNLFFEFTASGRREITWDAGGGAIYRTALRGRALDDFIEFNRAWAEGMRRRIDRRFRAALAGELEPVFADVEQRIPQYGEWVFDWWTSYILVVRGMTAIWGQLANGGEQSFEQVVERVMADAIKDQYIHIVLPPESFRPALQKAVGRAAALATTEELQQACLEMRGRFLALIAEHGGQVEMRVNGDKWLPDRNWQSRMTDQAYCSAPGQHVNAAVGKLQAAAESTFGDTGAIEDVAIRITRPVVTTVVSAGLSASSLAAVATGIGIPAALVATPAMAAVLTKSAFTLVDLMLSELDEALNRTTFEAAVRDAVLRTRSQFELTAQRAVHEAVERELAAMGIGRAP